MPHTAEPHTNLSAAHDALGAADGAAGLGDVERHRHDDR